MPGRLNFSTPNEEEKKKEPTQFGRLGIKPLTQREKDLIQQQESWKRQEEATKKEENRPWYKKALSAVTDVIKPSNIKSTIQNTTKGSSLETSAAVGSGLLDIGPRISNTIGVGNMAKSFLGTVNPMAKPILDQVNLPNPQLPLPGKTAMEYSNNSSDLSMALYEATTQWGGFELGGAAVRPLGLNRFLTGVSGNVLGGQAVLDQNISPKDRVKQAVLDGLFGVATEGLGAGFRRLIKPKVEISPKEVIKNKVIEKVAPVVESKTIDPVRAEAEMAKTKPDPLITEARKYKSAEEFIRNQSNAYHGTAKSFDFFDEGKRTIQQGESSKAGFHFTTDVSEAKIYANEAAFTQKVPGKGEVMSVKLEYKNPKYLQEGQSTAKIERVIQAKKEGYDAVIDDRGNIVVFDKSQIKTKSQLTDIWNKAQGKPKVETPKTSKVAQSIEAKSVEKKLTEGFDGLAGYDPITVKDQATRATDILKDPNKAMRIIKGEDPLPEGVRGASIIKAAEDYIERTGDGRMAYELANSPLVSETSAAAQELRLLAERVPDSATARLQELKKIREAAVEKKYGSVKKATNFVKEQIKKEVARKAPKAKDWASFLDELKCS